MRHYLLVLIESVLLAFVFLFSMRILSAARGKVSVGARRMQIFMDFCADILRVCSLGAGLGGVTPAAQRLSMFAVARLPHLVSPFVVSAIEQWSQGILAVRGTNRGLLYNLGLTFRLLRDSFPNIRLSALCEPLSMLPIPGAPGIGIDTTTGVLGLVGARVSLFVLASSAPAVVVFSLVLSGLTHAVVVFLCVNWVFQSFVGLCFGLLNIGLAEVVEWIHQFTLDVFRGTLTVVLRPTTALQFISKIAAKLDATLLDLLERTLVQGDRGGITFLVGHSFENLHQILGTYVRHTPTRFPFTKLVLPNLFRPWSATILCLKIVGLSAALLVLATAYVVLVIVGQVSGFLSRKFLGIIDYIWWFLVWEAGLVVFLVLAPDSIIAALWISARVVARSIYLLIEVGTRPGGGPEFRTLLGQLAGGLFKVDPTIGGGRTAEGGAGGAGGPDSHNQPSGENALFSTKLIHVLRDQVMSVIAITDSWRLPEVVRARYRAPSLETIGETLDILRSLGWPVDKDVVLSQTMSDVAAGDRLWASFSLGQINAVTPLRKLIAAMTPEMSGFGFPEVAGYINTGTYTSATREFASTARYWHPVLDISAEQSVVDDVWEVVRKQFEFSQLVAPATIVKNFVKKYNLGFGFSRRDKKDPAVSRPKKRSYVIREVGGLEQFTRLWEATVGYAGELTSVASVFTKLESLKPAKALAGLVRTVIGSALPHHIFSTVYNYGPNHNYKIWDVPMKVGMPITGTAFGKLWKFLSGRKYTFAGDMTAFDSSLQPVIIRMCAEIRKRGYQWHPDSAKICGMIDVAYDQLMSQPMAFRSTGDIMAKEIGLSTGHSATSPDNSLALVSAYMLCWKRITGKGAVEFLHFNSLVNFGDDHLLGYDEYPGWNPVEISKAMASIGCLCRNEHPEAPLLGIEGKSFLAKFPLKSESERERVRRAGVATPPEWLTYHSKARLIGKIKGETLQKDKLIRYQRLISYTYLCAHHEDVYRSTIRAANSLLQKHGSTWVEHHLRVPRVPSYDDVLYKWYTATASVVVRGEEEGIDESEGFDPNSVYIYGGTTVLDSLNKALSNFPEILSPKFINSPWVVEFQRSLGKFLSWVPALLRSSNSGAWTLTGLGKVMDRTPYGFLTAEVVTSHRNELGRLDLVFRHWLFMLYRLALTPKQAGIGFLGTIWNVDSVLADASFLLDGSVVAKTVNLEFHLADTLVISAIGLVPELFRGLEFPKFPQLTLSTFVAGILSRAWLSVQPSARVSYDLARATVIRMRTNERVTVVAPTGVGKSTRLISLIHEWTGKRVVVFEPRSLLALGLSRYCRRIFRQNRYGASTSGGFVPKDWDIIYGTVQSLFRTEYIHDRNVIFVVDESHFREAHYLFLRRWLIANDLGAIFLTATPPVNDEGVTQTILLDNISHWRVSRTDREVPTENRFIRDVIDHIHVNESRDTFLVFVTSVTQADRLVEQLGDVSSFVISSGVEEIPVGKDVYVTTKVSDAGLTIPDVSIVYTMDIDLDVVSSISNLMSADPVLDTRTVLYRLPGDTISQRLGRTGRTNHGQAFVYHIGGPFPDHQIPPATEHLVLGDLLRSDPSLEVFCSDELRREHAIDSAAVNLGLRPRWAYFWLGAETDLAIGAKGLG
jgi:hypothetical protein